MYIIALDPSLTSTGLAVYSTELQAPVDFFRLKMTSKSDVNERIRQVLSITKYYISKYNNIQCIALENGYVGSNMGGSLKLERLRGAIVGRFIEQYEIDERTPTEWRKAAGLSGDIKKEKAAEFIESIYPNIVKKVGSYSDVDLKKQKIEKTSDIYDALLIGYACLKSK